MVNRDRRKLVGMKLVAATSLLLFGLTAYGQRGAAHGGFSGHAATSFHAGGGGLGHAGFSGVPRYAGSAGRYAHSATRFAGRQGFGTASGYRSGYANRVAAGRPNFYSRAQASYGVGGYPNGLRVRPGGDGYGRDRLRFAYPGYGLAYGLGYGLGSGFLGYSYLGDLLDYPDGFDDGAQPTQSPDSYADAPYPLLPPDQGEPYAGMNGQMPPPPQAAGDPWQPAARVATAPVEEEDAVTIVFKDGRPSEQIRNYALTRTALYVPGKHMREIPVDQIDLPATEKVNRAAGVDFALPQAQ